MKNKDTPSKDNGSLGDTSEALRAPIPQPIPPSPVKIAEVGDNEDLSRPRNPIV